MIHLRNINPSKGNLVFGLSNELNDLLNNFEANNYQINPLDKLTNLPHNKNMSQTIKFYTAVLVTIRDLAKYQQKFSIYELTTKLRESVNNGGILFSDRDTEDVNGVNTYRVEHDDVKDIILDIYNTQVVELIRTYNGTYYEYAVKLAQLAPVSTSVSQSNVVTKVTSSPTTQPAAAQANPIKVLVPNMALVDYLFGRGTGSVVTMKQVQSRFDTVRGVSCVDYAKQVEDHGFKVDKTRSKFPSNWSTVIR
jgi:hypothetical protein